MLEMSLRLSTLTSARYDIDTSSIVGDYKQMRGDDNDSNSNARLLVVEPSDAPHNDVSSTSSSTSPTYDLKTQKKN